MAFDKMFGIGIALSVIDKVSLATRGIVNSLGNVEKAAARADKVLGMARKSWGMGWRMTAVGAGMTAPFVLMGKTMMNAMSDMEVFKAKLETALKSPVKAAEMMKWADVMAVKMPFTLGEVVDSTTRLEMYGMSAKKWLPLTGDMAGAMGRSVVDAVEAVADAVSGGGLERLKEFGVTSLMLKGAGWSGTYQTVAGLESLKKALQGVMMGKFGGGMERLMGTFTGKWSNLSDAIDRFKRIAGEALFEKLKGRLDDLLKLIDRLSESGTLKRWADIVGASFIQAIGFLEKTGKAIGAVVMPMVQFLQAHPALASMLGTLAILSGLGVTVAGTILMIVGSIGFLIGNALLVIPIIAKVGFVFWAIKYYAIIASQAVWAFFISAGKAVMLFMTTNPIGWVLLAISAIVMFAMAWKNNWLGIGTFMDSVVEGIGDAFVAIWRFMTGLQSKMWEAGKNVVIGIINVFTAVWRFIIDLGPKMWEAGKNVVMSIVGGIKSVIMWPYNTLKDGLDRMRRLLPFSPAKEGPLKDIEQSGFSFGKMFAEGIDKSAPIIRSSAYGAMAGAMMAAATVADASSIQFMVSALPSKMIEQYAALGMPPLPAYMIRSRGQDERSLQFAAAQTELTEIIKSPLEKPTTSTVADIGGDYGFGGGGGSSVTNNYYTYHVEKGAVVLGTGEAAGDSFDRRVETALNRLLKVW